MIGLALAACGGGNIQNAPAPSGGGGQAANCGKLNMAINPWVGYEASAHVVGYVAKTKLGCDVEYKNVKEEVAWQGMGNGEVDVVIENWGHPDLVQPRRRRGIGAGAGGTARRAAEGPRGRGVDRGEDRRGALHGGRPATRPRVFVAEWVDPPYGSSATGCRRWLTSPAVPTC